LKNLIIYLLDASAWILNEFKKAKIIEYINHCRPFKTFCCDKVEHM